MSAHGVDVVLDEIQKTYGRGGLSVLGAAVATRAVEALRRAGWVPPEEVAAIVAAAGGEVVVTPRHLTSDYLLISEVDAATGGVRIAVQKS